ncbi:HD-GYP domain-containing protein [Aquabacterium sp.]|uniref:HD-GYP domain-containing protein n=1 Tax=Aquabacterium sp. TaxID=1872578 RepID=UPI002CF3D8B6|nr:HD domain-containing phosphohydrolase [Aquabacterium sp.]HSW04358.1 HD domain-containing phosphohydrolase [Aquabacterium sp.]
MSVPTRKPGELPIQASQVRVGLHVRLPLSWLDHPFLSSSFLVTTEDQVREILALGVEVYCDPKRSKVMPAPLASAAAVDPAHELELTLVRQRQEAQRQAKAVRVKVMADMRAKLDVVQKQYMSAAEQTANAFKLMGARPAECVGVMREVAAESARSLLADPDSAIILIADKAKSQGEVAHALSVMTLSLLLAKQLQLPEAEIQLVGMAALMHDIGHSGVNPSILRNPARNRHEEAVFQTHARLGFDQLAAVGAAVPQGVAEAALHHHERDDGKGFPSGLKGAAIPRLARIVGIANRFDNLANPVDPRTAVSPFEALGVMWAREKTAFEEVLLQTFIRTMGIYPPGTLVQLSDGRSGVVVATAPPSARLCPQVLIYDPDTPRREALILDLADPETAQQLKVLKAVRMQERSEDELDYLLPRRKMSWYRGNS